jgi:hypothetical protein
MLYTHSSWLEVSRCTIACQLPPDIQNTAILTISEASGRHVLPQVFFGPTNFDYCTPNKDLEIWTERLGYHFPSPLLPESNLSHPQAPISKHPPRASLSLLIRRHDLTHQNSQPTGTTPPLPNVKHDFHPSRKLPERADNPVIPKQSSRPAMHPSLCPILG